MILVVRSGQGCFFQDLTRVYTLQRNSVNSRSPLRRMKQLDYLFYFDALLLFIPKFIHPRGMR